MFDRDRSNDGVRQGQRFAPGLPNALQLAGKPCCRTVELEAFEVREESFGGTLFAGTHASMKFSDIKNGGGKWVPFGKRSPTDAAVFGELVNKHRGVQK